MTYPIWFVEEVGDVDGDPRVDPQARAGIDYIVCAHSNPTADHPAGKVYEICTVSDRETAYKIAAAPDLLAALEDAEEALLDFEGTGDAIHLVEVLVDIRAAIAKAEKGQR